MKILLSIFLLFSFAANAQDTTKYMAMSAKGYKFNGGTFKNIWIGQDTTNYKTGIARIGSTLYAGNGTKWTAAAGSGTTGIDSVTITSTGCVKTFSTWSGGTESVIGTVTQPNGLAPGTGIATKTTGTTFTVTAATYTINCITYQSRDTTITLTAAGDTGRIDVIKVNTSGVTTQGTGTEGEALALPSLSATELALTYVLVTDTGVTVSLPADTALWVSVGTSIRNANTGPVNVRTSLRVGTYSVPVTDAKIHTDGIIHAAGGVSVDPAVNIATLTGIYPNGSNSGKLMSGNNVDATWGINGTTTRSHFGINGGFNTAAGASGLYSALSISSSIQQAGSPGANTRAYAFQDIGTVINQGTSGTGTIWGTYYHPSITALNGSSHIAYENTSGDIIHRNLAGSGTRMVVVNDTGLVSTQAIPGGGGGSVGTLQQVTDLDSTTTHQILINGAKFYAEGNPSFNVMAGTAAGFNNTGIRLASFGFGAAANNTGNQINAFGNQAAFDNTGDTVNAFGNMSAQSNTGNNVNALGTMAGEFNSFDHVNLFGYNAQADGNNQTVFSTFSNNLRIDYNSLTADRKLTVQNTSGTIALVQQLTDSLNILRDSLAAYRAQDTVYTESGIQTVFSGDSTKIRLPYKSYVALLSQSGTDAPTAIVLQNDFDGNIIWARSSTGNYTATLSGAFTENKSWCVVNNTNDAADAGYFSLRRVDSDSFIMSTFDISVTNVDDLLINTSVEIRVYY